MNEPTLRTTVIRLFAALSALLFIAALAPLTSIAAGKTVVVNMTDTSAGFVPEKVTIKVGDTIEWQNGGASLHSVDANPATAQKPTDVVLPKGARPLIRASWRPVPSTAIRSLSRVGIGTSACPMRKSG
jgi:plastocyanin